MKHARADYNRIQDPEGKIGEDEPVFIFRAKDVLASVVLAEYANLLRLHGCQQEMIDATLCWEAEMRKWGRINGCKLPDMPIPTIENVIAYSKPETKPMDFSGWVGHRARMLGGSEMKIQSCTETSLLSDIETRANYVWDIFTGRNVVPGNVAYDLVELLDGPTRERKGE